MYSFFLLDVLGLCSGQFGLSVHAYGGLSYELFAYDVRIFAIAPAKIETRCRLCIEAEPRRHPRGADDLERLGFAGKPSPTVFSSRLMRFYRVLHGSGLLCKCKVSIRRLYNELNKRGKSEKLATRMALASSLRSNSWVRTKMERTPTA